MNVVSEHRLPRAGAVVLALVPLSPRPGVVSVAAFVMSCLVHAGTEPNRCLCRGGGLGLAGIRMGGVLAPPQLPVFRECSAATSCCHIEPSLVASQPLALVRYIRRPPVSYDVREVRCGPYEGIHDTDLAVGRRDELQDALALKSPRRIQEVRRKRRHRWVQVARRQHRLDDLSGSETEIATRKGVGRVRGA